MEYSKLGKRHLCMVTDFATPNMSSIIEKKRVIYEEKETGVLFFII